MPNDRRIRTDFSKSQRLVTMKGNKNMQQESGRIITQGIPHSTLKRSDAGERHGAARVPARPGVRVYPHRHGIHTFCFWDTHRIHTLEPWDTHVIHANHEKKERNLGHPPQDTCYGNVMCMHALKTAAEFINSTCVEENSCGGRRASGNSPGFPVWCPAGVGTRGNRGNVCLARARRATFLLTIPTSAPDLSSHGEAPQVDHIALHTFPTKHVAKESRICEFNHSNCHL